MKIKLFFTCLLAVVLSSVILYIYVINTRNTLSGKIFHARTKIVETALELNIMIGESINVKDTPIIIELNEIDDTKQRCKLFFSNSSTLENVQLWAIENQPIKIEKFFGSYGIKVSRITKNSVTLIVPYGGKIEWKIGENQTGSDTDIGKMKD